MTVKLPFMTLIYDVKALPAASSQPGTPYTGDATSMALVHADRSVPAGMVRVRGKTDTGYQDIDVRREFADLLRAPIPAPDYDFFVHREVDYYNAIYGDSDIAERTRLLMHSGTIDTEPLAAETALRPEFFAGMAAFFRAQSISQYTWENTIRAERRWGWLSLAVSVYLFAQSYGAVTALPKIAYFLGGLAFVVIGVGKHISAQIQKEKIAEKQGKIADSNGYLKRIQLFIASPSEMPAQEKDLLLKDIRDGLNGAELQTYLFVAAHIENPIIQEMLQSFEGYGLIDSYLRHLTQAEPSEYFDIYVKFLAQHSPKFFENLTERLGQVEQRSRGQAGALRMIERARPTPALQAPAQSTGWDGKAGNA